MKVLVTGATGTVGGEVVKELLQRGADVRALTRKQPEPGTFPGAVEIARGGALRPCLGTSREPTPASLRN